MLLKGGVRVIPSTINPTISDGHPSATGRSNILIRQVETIKDSRASRCGQCMYISEPVLSVLTTSCEDL